MRMTKKEALNELPTHRRSEESPGHRRGVRAGAGRPVAEKLDRDGVFPTSLFHALAEIGVTSIPFAESEGGMGLGTFEMVLALEQIARCDQSLAVSTMVSVATGLTLSRFGTPAQKDRFLPDIVAGKKICAIAGTEPNAGSDTAGFTTRGRLTDGKWVINGEKAYITNAGTEISSFALVLVVTSPPDAPKKSFSLFLVPNGTAGYKPGEKYRKLGWKSSDTRPLYFDDCALTPDMAVGEPHKGRILLHKGYQQARVFLATCSLGLAQGSLDLAVSYAKERRAFGGSIGKLQLIQKMVRRHGGQGRNRPHGRLQGRLAGRPAARRRARTSPSPNITRPRSAANAPIWRSRSMAAGASWTTARPRAICATTASAPSATVPARFRPC